MEKFITKDNLCYFRDKSGNVCSRNATPFELIKRDELRFEMNLQGVIL